MTYRGCSGNVHNPNVGGGLSRRPRLAGFSACELIVISIQACGLTWRGSTGYCPAQSWCAGLHTKAAASSNLSQSASVFNWSDVWWENNAHGNIEPSELRCAYTCIYMNMYSTCVCVSLPTLKQCLYFCQMPVLKDQRCKSFGIQLKWRFVRK